MCHAEAMNFFLHFAQRLKLSKKPGVSEDSAAYETTYFLKVLGDG